MKKIAIFIDEANLISSAIELKIFIDYIKLKDYLVGKNELYNCFFYTQGSYEDYHDSEKSDFYKKLTLNGFTVKMKPIKKIPGTDKIRSKCNVDVELTLDVATTVNNYDIAILLTGDGDFCKLVEFLRFKGKEIICASTRETSSIDIRNAVDKFIYLEKIISKVKLEKPYKK